MKVITNILDFYASNYRQSLNSTVTNKQLVRYLCWSLYITVEAWAIEGRVIFEPGTTVVHTYIVRYHSSLMESF